MTNLARDINRERRVYMGGSPSKVMQQFKERKGSNIAKLRKKQ